MTRLLLLALAGIAAGAASVLLKAANGNGPMDIMMTTVSGLAFIGAGLVAIVRQPTNRTGLLMVLVGFALFAEDLQLSTGALVFTVGKTLASVSVPMFVWLVLAYPTGRLATTTARTLVALSFVVSVGLETAHLMVEDVAWYRDADANLLLVWPSETARTVIRYIQYTAATVVDLAILVVLIRRWRAATGPGRRLLAPVYSASALGGLTGLVGLLTRDIVDLPALYRVSIVVSGVAFALLPLLFLLGVLRWRLRASPVDGMLAALSSAPTETDLEQLLRVALDDPTLVLEQGPVAAASAERAVTPIRFGGAVIATIRHDPALREDSHALAAAASAAGLAMHNQQLRQDLDVQLTALRDSSAELVRAVENARHQVERDLHDGAQQQLIALGLQIALLRQRLDPDRDRDAMALAAAAASSVSSALIEIRQLARGLQPGMIGGDLTTGLTLLVDRAAPVPVELDVSELPDLPDRVAVTAYFIAAEALSNAIKHARPARLTVRCHADPVELVVSIADDGTGGAIITRGGGLDGLRDRARALGGELTVHAGQVGGTEVTARLPLGVR